MPSKSKNSFFTTSVRLSGLFVSSSDDLDGNMFTDDVAPIRKKMLSKKLQNIQKGKVHPRYASKLK